MKEKIFYALGCVLIASGLLWVLLPHAFHESVIQEDNPTPHLVHIFQGFIVVIIGLIIIAATNKKFKKANVYKSKR